MLHVIFHNFFILIISSCIRQVFCDLPNLQILNLHGNAINDIKEADKLLGVGKLRKLSLHGNPIENVKVIFYNLTFLNLSCHSN